MTNIYELLDQGKTLISDGAMGTMLQNAGLTDGGAPELWNVEHPDKVAEILDNYAKNGANLLTTNTDRKSTRLNSSHSQQSRMPSSA